MYDALIDAIAVTAELTGRKLTEGAVRVMVKDLAAYPLPAVLKALERTRHELRGPFTVAEVIARIDDGHPGVEEAWAMCPRSESDGVVWTQEIADAYFATNPDDHESARRMTFKEIYSKSVAEARREHRKPHWWVSRGNQHSTEEAVRNALAKGRIGIGLAQQHVLEAPEELAKLLPAPADAPLLLTE